MLEVDSYLGHGMEPDRLPPSRTAILPNDEPSDALWKPLCTLLGLAPPIHAFPVGPPREWRIFRDDRAVPTRLAASARPQTCPTDDSQSPFIAVLRSRLMTIVPSIVRYEKRYFPEKS